MTSHLWCWSDIVNPSAVEAAMAEEERRAKRQQRRASNDPVEGEDGPRPVAA